MAKLPDTYTITVKFEGQLGEDLEAADALEGFEFKKLKSSEKLVRLLTRGIQEACDNGEIDGFFQVVSGPDIGGTITDADRKFKAPEWPELDAEREFILVGDIRHPGRVSVKARTREEAVELAEKGEFEVYDETKKCLAFDWNGDDATVEEKE
jgi:hypothetical protein